MSRRRVRFVEGNYFHVYNRSVAKQQIFFNSEDHYRFMSCMYYYQAHLGPFSKHYRGGHKINWYRIKSNMFPESAKKSKRVKLCAYCIMPNHYHLLVQELKPQKLVRYIHDVQLSYSKYFNIKRGRVGPLWTGPYKLRVIRDLDDYQRVVKYIHQNPIKSKSLNFTEETLRDYRYSSYSDPI